MHCRPPPWSFSRPLSAIAVLALLVAAIVLALLIYPGELSHVNTALNRWLYDRGAADYERKWNSAAYQAPQYADRIKDFARSAVSNNDAPTVLDLGCGTGAGIRLVLEVLPDTTHFVGVDFSAQMLRRFQAWIDTQSDGVRRRIDLVECDLASWSNSEAEKKKFDLLLLLEVGEFVPGFEKLLRRASKLVVAGGGLIMTRPAAPWSWVFLRRFQSRQRLTRLLVDCGFDAPEIVPWRSRYELLFACRKDANN